MSFMLQVFSPEPKMNRLTVPFEGVLWRSSQPTAAFTTCSRLWDKSNYNRQGKILGKLFGNRVSGSKKRWFENPMPTSRTAQAAMSSPLNFTHSKKNDQGTNRRTTVLNKLFMTQITDLLATGKASQKILGKGLQITRVKVTPNFQFCNIFWMAKGGAADVELEEELQKCGGMLRHELSQLRLMGEVPRIHFVKDKTFANLSQVETVLKTCDFGEDHKNMDPSYQVKLDLYRNPAEPQSKERKTDEDVTEQLPEMRHDVFGVDHRGIMIKILAKLKKSEQAWEQYDRPDQTSDVVQKSTALEKLQQIQENKAEENDDSFNIFLTKLAESRGRRERRFRKIDDGFYRKIDDDVGDPLDDGDYIEEDYDEKK